MPSALKTCSLLASALLLSISARAATSTVTLPGAALRATLQAPDRVTSPPVVLLLGSDLGGDGIRQLADALQRAGYATLRPLRAGPLPFGNAVQTARAWLGWASAQRVYGPLVLLGYGDGLPVGLAALQPPLPGPADWQRTGLSPDVEVSALVGLDGGPFGGAPDPLPLLAALRLPVLLVQGGQDARTLDARTLAAAARRPAVLLLPEMNRQLVDVSAGRAGGTGGRVPTSTSPVPASPGSVAGSGSVAGAAPLDPALLRGITGFLDRLREY